MSFDVRALPALKFLLILFCANLTIHAEDVILITADRIESSTDKSTNDVRIITSEEIKKSSSTTLTEILRKESDLSVVSSGPNGSNSSLFLRGTDSSHTLVVIDGIVMNDPSNPNRQFDIGRLSLNNVERIEILKGSQGLAYGSNAIGGVVVITTKKSKGTDSSGGYYLDFGTYETINAGTNFQKKYQLANISFGADIMETDGFSAANKKYNLNAEDDGAQRVSFSLGVDKELSNELLLDINLHYSHNRADLDKGGGAGSDDPNDVQKEEELYSKIQLTKNWDSGNATTKFYYNRSKHYRLLEASSSSVSSGIIDSINANHTYYINESLTQNLNVEFSHEKDQSAHYNQNVSGFLYHQYETLSSIYNFGIRLDNNKYFDEHLTYKLAAAYKFNSALVKISHSTGFRAPSLNQLYDPVYGNKSLSPETSHSSDLSLDNEFNKKLKNTSTLFYTKINNRLSYNRNTFVNINSGKAEIIGLEEKILSLWSAVFNQALSFTLLKTHDLSRGTKLARRPDLNVKNVFTFYLFEKHHIAYELSYIGKRSDVDNLGNAVKMDYYLKSDIDYQFHLNPSRQFYLKIKNLFNTEYEEIFGFGTGGRILSAGTQYSF